MRTGGVRATLRPIALGAVLAAGCTSYVTHLSLGHPAAGTVNLTAQEAGSDAVILSDERWITHVFDTGDPSTTEEVRRAIYLVNEAGRDHARVQIPYSPEAPIVEIEARTILPDGTAVSVPRSAIHDSEIIRTGGTGGETMRAKTFAFPRAGPGAIVELHFVRRHPGWLMSLHHVVSRSIPVRDARLTVEMPRVAIRYESRGFGDPERRLGRKTWRLRNIEPPPDVPYGLPERLRAPFVSISVQRIDFFHGAYHIENPVYATWPSVASPVWGYVEKVIETPPFGVARLAEGGDTAKARYVWQTVQRQMDDRARLSQRRGRPRNADEIYSSGFGTADERALVMLAALRAARVPALLLLLPGEDDEDVSETFPTPERLSDFLVCVPTGTPEPLLLDPSCLGCAAGELAVHHQGRAGLLVTDAQEVTPGLVDFESSPREHEVRVKTRRFVTKPPNSSVAPVELTAQIVVNDRGLVAQRGVWTARGALAASIRHHFAQHPITEAKRRETMRKRYLDGVQGGRVALEGLHDPGAPIRAHMKDVLLERGGFVRAGEWTLISAQSVQRDGWVGELLRKRDAPVHFDVAPGFARNLRILLPPGHELVSIPQAQRIKTAVGTYDLRVTRELGAVVLREELKLTQQTFRDAQRANLVVFLHRVHDCRQRSVVLRKTTTGDSGSASLP